MKPAKPIRRISEKRLKALGGRHPSSTAKRSSKQIKKVNRKRKDREFSRVYHSEERVLFVKGLSCVIDSPWCLEGWENGERVENAHIRTGGTGRKAGYTEVVPLCESHHRHLHRVGRATFEKHYHIDLGKLAAETQSRWEAHTEEGK